MKVHLKLDVGKGTSARIDLIPETIGEQRVLDLLILRELKDDPSRGMIFNESWRVPVTAKFFGHRSHDRAEKLSIVFDPTVEEVEG